MKTKEVIKKHRNSIKYPRERYFDRRYLSKFVFLSYFHQVNEVLASKPKTVLEIGVGNNYLSSILKNYGVDVTTCDFNPELKPDVVAEVTDLKFKENSYDTVVACGILEHIDYRDVSSVLSNLKKIARNKVIVSIPCACARFDFLGSIYLPFIKIKYLKFGWRIPYSWFTSRSETCSHEDHFWAAGRKGYPKDKIIKLIKKHFLIEKQFHEDLNSGHWFFVLKPKGGKQ